MSQQLAIKEMNHTNDRDHKDRDSALNRILGVISGSFAPILGVLAGSGLLSALLTVLTKVGWMSPKSGTYAIFAAAAHAIFYFLPFFLGSSLAKKLGANPYVGGAIGAALLEPHYTDLIAAKAHVDFMGIPVLLMNYSSTVFPIFIAVSIYAAFDRFLRKVVHKDFQMFINPLLSLIVIVPLTILLFGPFGTYVGDAIAAFIKFLSSKSGILTGVVLGAGWTFLTILGLHWTLIPIAIANLAHGGDPIIGMASAAPFAQIGIALGVFLKTKDKNLKTISASAILPGLLAGTTELINYGIILQFKRTMIYVAIAGAVGGAINGLLGIKCIAFAFPSALTIPAFAPMGLFLIGITVALVLGLLMTYILGFEDKKAASRLKAGTSVESVKGETITSPVSGEVVPLNHYPGPLFSTETVGKGIAIEPTEGKIFAPVDGTVFTLFPTKHAIGILSEGGAEVLIFIGVDTIKLHGQYFTSHVKQDDVVKQGDLLIEFDLEKIKAAGYEVTTPVVITNPNQYIDIEKTKQPSVNASDRLIKVVV
jgi:PTS system beta-glucosides-specific IIC component